MKLWEWKESKKNGDIRANDFCTSSKDKKAAYIKGVFLLSLRRNSAHGDKGVNL